MFCQPTYCLLFQIHFRLRAGSSSYPFFYPRGLRYHPLHRALIFQTQIEARSHAKQKVHYQVSCVAPNTSVDVPLCAIVILVVQYCATDYVHKFQPGRILRAAPGKRRIWYLQFLHQTELSSEPCFDFFDCLQYHNGHLLFVPLSLLKWPFYSLSYDILSDNLFTVGYVYSVKN